MPLKVLFFDHTAKLGGGELALLHLLRYLDKRRFQPVVVLGEEGPLAEKLRESKIETCILPLGSGIADTRKDSLGVNSLLQLRAIWAALFYCWKLTRFIKLRNIDLVHTNSLKADIIGGVSARLAGVPVVWHVRDRIDSDYLPALVARAFRVCCRIIPSYIVANSAATLETLHLHGGVHSTVVHSGSAVVHDGVVPRGTTRKGISQSARVGLVGRITPWKGQHIFLASAVEVKRRFPFAKFQIIGSAMFGEEAYESEIRNLAHSLGLDDCVEFTGFRKDVPRLIDALDLLVHASTTGEPFGQVIVEGMVARKPVVATRGGGVPEIVQDGITGILVPMGDSVAMAQAICELLSDPGRACLMGEAGYERVMHNFTVEMTARRLENVFEKVMPRASNPPELAITPATKDAIQ